jgi:hypothetical protein
LRPLVPVTEDLVPVTEDTDPEDLALSRVTIVVGAKGREARRCRRRRLVWQIDNSK